MIDRAVLRLAWSSLRRTRPVSEWGEGRGRPIDRWYVDSWIAGHGAAVRGDVLEVLEDLYASRLGAERVHVVDIDEANPRASVVGDLCDAETLPRAAYDCVILTQTLHLLSSPAAALRHVLEALRPGGTLLLSSPLVSRTTGPADRYRWTPLGLHELLTHVLDGAGDGAQIDAEVTEVRGHGNMLAARAFLLGIACEDLDAAVLDVHDEAFPLVVTAVVRRR